MTKKHDIIWVESVDSTNEECRRHISEIDNLSVLSAMSQTKGRGQRGNSWSSAPGENLTFSIVLKFPLPGEFAELEPMHAYDQFILSQIASLSVIELLSEHGIKAQIKWPNDIYVGDRKICGMLIENSVRGEWMANSIIGIGLNINQRNFDVSIPNPTSMALCSSDPDISFDKNKLLEVFMDIFKEYMNRYCHIRGGYGRLCLLYLAQLWRKDIPATYLEHESEEFTGIIRGVSDKGCLLVETPEGIIKEFSFKEISYII